MRSRGAVLAGSVVAGLLLAGCGTTTTVASERERPSSTSDATAAPTADPASDPAPGTSSAQRRDRQGRDRPAAVPAALDFRSRTVDGADFDGASLAGKPVVLWFWAPWCPTCRGQIDAVSAAATARGDQVSFVGVGSLDDGEAIAGFAGDVPSEEVTQLTDPEGAVWRHFGITEQSTYVVLDARGEQVAHGYLDDDELRSVVDDLAG